jgi:hypothetical protein
MPRRLALGAGLNEIAVERELANERIDLAQLQRQLRKPSLS